MIRKIAVLLLLLLAIGGIGCGAYRPPSNTLAADPIEQDSKVVYLNLSLKIWVFVREVKVERQGELLLAKIMLENKRDENTPIEIKTKWLDKDGYEIKDMWGKRPVFLKRNEIKTEQFIAPDPRAVDVRFLINVADEADDK